MLGCLFLPAIKTLLFNGCSLCYSLCFGEFSFGKTFTEHLFLVFGAY